jgi:hypothetical protein
MDYGWLGEVAEQIAASAAVSEEMVKGYVAAFAVRAAATS